MAVHITFTAEDVQWEASNQGQQISQKKARKILEEIDEIGWLNGYNVQIMRMAYHKYLDSKEIEEVG